MSIAALSLLRAGPRRFTFSPGRRPDQPRARRAVLALLLGGAVMLAGCTAAARFRRPAEGEPHHVVYVVQRGWHTGIAVGRAEIAPALWPEKADFPAGGYLEAGWGDWDFYQAEESGPGMATAAGLLSARSVLNVERIPAAVPDRYPCSPVIELRVPPAGFERLVRFIHDSVERGAAARATPLPSSLAGHSHFYPARGRFHMLNNCNTWVLRGIAAAGYPITPLLGVTAASVRARLGGFGRLIEPRAGCP